MSGMDIDPVVTEPSTIFIQYIPAAPLDDSTNKKRKASDKADGAPKKKRAVAAKAPAIARHVPGSGYKAPRVARKVTAGGRADDTTKLAKRQMAEWAALRASGVLTAQLPPK
jgi:hypothetical protein